MAKRKLVSSKGARKAKRVCVVKHKNNTWANRVEVSEYGSGSEQGNTSEFALQDARAATSKSSQNSDTEHFNEDGNYMQMKVNAGVDNLSSDGEVEETDSDSERCETDDGTDRSETPARLNQGYESSSEAADSADNSAVGTPVETRRKK